jgi:ribosome-binding protein aMBF1 (putative translation factor)
MQQIDLYQCELCDRRADFGYEIHITGESYKACQHCASHLVLIRRLPLKQSPAKRRVATRKLT